MAHLINKSDLPHSGTAHRFDGNLFGDCGISFFWTDAEPGTGPLLHSHPYAEIFIIQEGNVTFTVGDEVIEATAGQIVIAPAGQPHKFTNVGPGIARHIDIHASDEMITTWLENEDR